MALQRLCDRCQKPTPITPNASGMVPFVEGNFVVSVKMSDKNSMFAQPVDLCEDCIVAIIRGHCKSSPPANPGDPASLMDVFKQVQTPARALTHADYPSDLLGLSVGLF